MSEKWGKITIISLCNSYGEVLNFHSRSVGYSPEQLEIINAVMAGKYGKYHFPASTEADKYQYYAVAVPTRCPDLEA